jgi:hypothetical protein
MRTATIASIVLVVVACGPAEREPERWPREPVALLEVGMACFQDPSLMADWFPRHSLKMPMEQSWASDPDHVERIMGHRRCEAGAIARAYQEPVLASGSPVEVYRLVWMPSFAPPVVIRIEDRPEGVMVRLTRDRAAGEMLTGDLEILDRRVPRAQWLALRAVAMAAGCWEPGHTCGAESSVVPGVAWVDGEEWLVEGVQGRDHWGVVVDNPLPSPFQEVGKQIVTAADAWDWVRAPHGPWVTEE